MIIDTTLTKVEMRMLMSDRLRIAINDSNLTFVTKRWLSCWEAAGPGSPQWKFLAAGEIKKQYGN